MLTTCTCKDVLIRSYTHFSRTGLYKIETSTQFRLLLVSREELDIVTSVELCVVLNNLRVLILNKLFHELIHVWNGNATKNTHHEMEHNSQLSVRAHLDANPACHLPNSRTLLRCRTTLPAERPDVAVSTWTKAYMRQRKCLCYCETNVDSLEFCLWYRLYCSLFFSFRFLQSLHEWINAVSYNTWLYSRY